MIHPHTQDRISPAAPPIAEGPAKLLAPSSVWIRRCPACSYGRIPNPGFPEIPAHEIPTVLPALRFLFMDMGLDSLRFGTAKWNPLGALIEPGQFVVLKPNWVLHENHAQTGLDCLVTHPSILAALCHYLFKASPGRVVLGDAPVQGCDFEALHSATQLEAWLAPWRDRLEIIDFRLVTLPGGGFSGHRAGGTSRSENDYVSFDLGETSRLEPLSREATPEFRVTMYDPAAMKATHGPGFHTYLVAREMIEADVVFNLPKLKTHKKAGITGALKNLVGINGHKAYLPHHRKGGTKAGGDCYPGDSFLKRCAEHLLDQANRSTPGAWMHTLYLGAYAANRLAGGTKARAGIEGSWHGNDTIWRTSLDLQRLLYYGTTAGTFADTPQRTILSLTDAVIAGEGEGPLAPLPKPLGLLTLGANPAATEWVHGLLMGLDPSRIPITRGAFDQTPYPLASFSSSEVQPFLEGVPLDQDSLFPAAGMDFQPPAGWVGACERQGR